MRILIISDLILTSLKQTNIMTIMMWIKKTRNSIYIDYELDFKKTIRKLMKYDRNMKYKGLKE